MTERLLAPRTEFETLASAAERVDVSVQTLRRHIAKGELRAYRLGRRILRVRPDDVDNLLRPLPIARLR